jgi:hypothetical protein
MERIHKETAEVVNFNEVTFVSQAAQPTVTAKRVVIWKDSDATSGNSTHYIVANDGTTTVTFASVELVP